MPFRSETEQLRERLRRIEEKATELLEEQADLQRYAEPQGRRRTWFAGALVAVVVASFAGYMVGTLAVSKESARLREILERDHDEELAREHMRQLECRLMGAQLREDIAKCEGEVADKRHRPAEPFSVGVP